MANRNSALRRAQIILTPTNAAQPNRLSVAMDFNLDGDFADAGETIISPFDITTSNGAVPTTFKFGFAASTGAANNTHEIRNLIYETVNPTADIIDVTPDPRNSGVSSITIQFSEAVNGLDVNDISLTRNGSPISLATATVSTSNNITWTLNNLSGLTTTDGNYQITLNPTGSNIFTVVGGYAFTTSANDTWTVDATPPTVTSISSTTTNGTYGVGVVIPITVTFSEAVTVTGTPTLALNTGANATYASGSGTNTLTFNYTVATGNNTTDLDYSTTTALALNSGTIRDSVTNNATLTLPTPGATNSLGANKNLIIDTTAPTVSLSSAAASTTNAPFNVTATFSEAVSNFITSDISVTNGTVSGFSGSGSTYTFAVTPTNQGTVTVNVPAAVANDAGNNDNTAATALSRTYDTVAPTVSLTSAAAAITNAPFNVTATFSEAVSNFITSDVSVTNGTVSGFSGSGSTYTFTVNPTNQGTVTVNVPAAVATDTANNDNTAATALNRTYDSVAPTVSLTSAAAAITNAPFNVTATFSEAVSNFITSDVSVTNGTVSGFSGSGSTYTFAVTPTNQGTVTVNVPAAVATDTANNNNTAATALSRTYDTKYNGINPIDLAVINTDNDTAGVSLSAESLSVYEGGNAGYSIVLTSAPTAPVTINFTTDSQLIAPEPITFDIYNWNHPQTVTMTAVDDAVAAVNPPSIITHTIISADANYNGVNVGTVAANITDNDTAGLIVMLPVGSGDVIEGGGKDIYKLMLTQPPTADVVVSISGDSQLMVNTPSLTFTPSNWNQAQVWRVAAVDDAIVEGGHQGNVSFAITSGDGIYNQAAVAPVSINIADNDNVGIETSLPVASGIAGTDADDKIVGSAGADLVYSQGGNNYVDGGAGNDILYGGSDADDIMGGVGLDQIFGDFGADYLAGDEDDDVIFAGGGNDRIFGGSGNDLLSGDEGNDYLVGDGGVDSLNGGAGRDAFAVGNGFGGMTVEMADVITDFVQGEDVIDLIPDLVFGDLSMVQNGADAVIQNVVTSEFLAVLQGVNVASLTAVDFV